MKRIILALTLIFQSFVSINAQHLVSTEIIETFSPNDLNFIFGYEATFEVEMYKIIYNTTDAVGDPIIASGAFSRPISNECTNFPMMMYHHGTTLNKENVPSRINGESQLSNFFGGIGYYGMAPDYVGMGDSPGLHPY